MDIFDAINSRASAIRLGEPAPSREQLTKILEAGARAPDHGKLGPWHFIVLEKDARAILGNAMADAVKAKTPDAPEGTLNIERTKAMRAPAIVVVAAKLVDKGDKIPGIEQVVAVGAATENIFLAAHALGFGVMWRTGPAAYDPIVKRAVGLAPEDHIVAILYIGTPVTRGTSRAPLIEDRVTWL